MGMRIDEAGRDDLAARIDRALGSVARRRIRADVDDLFAGDDYVSLRRLRLAAVVDHAGADQHVGRFASLRVQGASRNRWGAERGRQQEASPRQSAPATFAAGAAGVGGSAASTAMRMLSRYGYSSNMVFSSGVAPRRTNTVSRDGTTIISCSIEPRA